MLKKLLKYEWKAVKGINLLLVVIAAGVCLLGVIYLQTPMWKKMITGGAAEDMFYGGTTVFLWMLLGLGGMFVYVIMLIGVLFGQMIYFGVRYYTSMFSDQGYLTHTLPVTPAQLLLSKVLIAGGWTFLISLLLTILTGVLLISAMCGIGGTSLSDVLRTIGDMAKDVTATLYDSKQGGSILGFVISVLMFLLNPFLSVSILFGALTIGHYSRKNKGLMGILAYFVVLFVRSILKNLVNIILGVILRAYWLEYGSYINNKNSSSFVVDTLLTVGLMFWAHQIISKKLNME